jgi:undecaprenyl-diphosphatase
MTVARQVWGFIERRDHRLMRRLNRWRAPRWIRYWMIAATRLGDGWLWYSLAALVLLYGGPQRYAAVSAATLAGVVGVGVFKLLKTLSQRPRPCQI